MPVLAVPGVGHLWNESEEHRSNPGLWPSRRGVCKAKLFLSSVLGGEPWAELGQELLVKLTLTSSAWVVSVDKGK